MSAKHPKSSQPTYDLDFIRAAAANQWERILSSVGGIDPSYLDGRHGPCPKCGGTDRWRFTNVDNSGSAICNKCGKFGNGFDVLMWLLNEKFVQVITKTADFLGIEPSKGGNRSAKESTDPAEHLQFGEWSPVLAAKWCMSKFGITPAAIMALGGKLAIYRNQYDVIAIPVWGEKLDQAKPVGWCLYNLAHNGKLPIFHKDKPTTWEKVKLTAGSKPGIMGNPDLIRTATTLWKLEGPTDVLAFHSLADIPPLTAALTNANGCGQNPTKTEIAWALTLFTGKSAKVCHDADQPGQAGAITHFDERGRPVTGWANAIAAHAAECRNILLPYEITETHGKDLRDWCNEGGTYLKLLELAENSAIITADAKPSIIANASQTLPNPATHIIEADDDPHRLARVNMSRYATRAGAALRYWRDEWYTWKPSRGCYRKIGESELRAKVSQTIKEEFDRLNLIDQSNVTGDKEPPEAKRVTKTLVSNVLAAMAGICCIPSSVEPMTWVSENGEGAQTRQTERSIVAMANGLIDIEALLAEKDEHEVILPHTADWFSTIRLPYAFNHEAKCPKWEAFLEKNLEMDPERIKLLQEWAGYLLLPDTGQQKFLALEGEGRNGKSVFCAAITGMLGAENCSHVPLEQFAERFARAQMIGKLVNIDADVGELDRVAEAYVKSFTSGDVVFFDRKGIAGVECVPTSRLILSWNNRPRFKDRSMGIWRRMLLVPWNVQIQDDEVVPNMDKAWWWERAGELPGIFMWALRGLIRLRGQGRFTVSELSRNALEEYRKDANPARAFLHEHCEYSENRKIKTRFLYDHYARWCDSVRCQALSEPVFGKEVKRVFPNSGKTRPHQNGNRHWYYTGIDFNCEEICGEKTFETNF